MADTNHKQSETIIRISVRSLVEFMLRSGDLYRAEGSAPDVDAMQAGSRIHRMIQRRRKGDYQAEAALSKKRSFKEGAIRQAPFDKESSPAFTLLVEGRADGIERDQKGYLIEEIKGIYQELLELEAPLPVHLAQAKCYAAIFASEHSLETIRVRMTYCHLETEEVRQFTEIYQSAALIEWFDALVEAYGKWAALSVRFATQRDLSLEGLEFPFEYRPGQRDMVVSIYRTIAEGRQIFLQAPTGLGKTMSAVFPAMRALGEGLAKKVFYLTAKTITRTVASEAFSILKEKGLLAKLLVLTAKEKICTSEEGICDPDSCPLAKGHFDRVNEALYEILTESDSWDRERILSYAEKHQVCPYALERDLVRFADAVICDYNYAFDPAARISEYFGDTARKGESILLVDEAHNLVDRAREMYSAEIEKEAFLSLRREVRKSQPKGAGGKADGRTRLAKGNLLNRLDAALTRCNSVMLAYKKECQEAVGPTDRWDASIHERTEITEIYLPLLNLLGALEDSLKKESGIALPEEALELYFQVRRFVSVADALDENYMIYTQALSGENCRLRLFCTRPAGMLQQVLGRAKSAVFYSATLLPIPYYESLLTTERENYSARLASPFDPSHRLVLLAADVSSRYTRRGAKEYARMAAYIREVTEAKSGNYMVYFPSYRMMEDVYQIFAEETGLLEAEQTDEEIPAYASAKADGLRVLVQAGGMREADREAFLSEFAKQQEGTLIAFCVMGGIFSEGIDLAGEQLIGAIVIGTGIPQVGPERELLKRFHDRRGESGFDYAYRYPGMNKVLQAAGRVIRTFDDVGVIALLDERFLEPAYQALFPREWAGARTVGIDTAGDVLRTFWEAAGEP